MQPTLGGGELQAKLRLTSIVVTHDMKSAEFVGDRLVLLHQGKVYFDGAPAEMAGSADGVVGQFLRGEADGPMTETIPVPKSGHPPWRRR